ncbi:MAG: ribonuclease P protein component [Williamsia sp.]|nr:ribonuclease P protein component [Williamsia sp.]
MHPPQTFSKQERLKSRKLIGQLFKEGRSFNIFPFKTYYLFPEERDAFLQAGFVVPSKLFKKAVHRNRIKRLMKEAYRFEKKVLEQSLVNKQNRLAVFFVYTGRELPLFAQVSGSMRSIIQKLTRIVHEKAPVHT